MDIVKPKPLQPATVLEQLGRLACHYPNSGHTKETMEVVTVDWYNEFKNLSDSRFVGLVTILLRTSQFFPTISSIVEVDEREPEWTTSPNEVANMREKIKQIKRKLNV